MTPKQISQFTRKEDVLYTLSAYGEALVNAMPDRKAVARVNKEFARGTRLKQKRKDVEK